MSLERSQTLKADNFFVFFLLHSNGSSYSMTAVLCCDIFRLAVSELPVVTVL